MSVLEAATAASIQWAAREYLEAGISVIPVRGKAANVQWKLYTTRRASIATLDTWVRKGLLSGVGLVCGEVSGGLVVIDIDSMAACDEYEAAFPDLRRTFTVRSGSGRGRHYYYYAADILPANTWRNGVELRANGSYVVGAPSPHPSGLAYCVVRRDEILRTKSLVAVRRWIIERGSGGGGGDGTPTPAAAPAPVGQMSAYGLAALNAEAAAVRMAPEGTANSTLYRAALKLGSLVGSGLLGRGQVEATLEAAAGALTARDGLTATRRTIASGLNIGIQSPRQVRK